jgi:hypothetical protein
MSDFRAFLVHFPEMIPTETNLSGRRVTISTDEDGAYTDYIE